MELLDFIQEHNNWRELIQEEPYYIKIKEDDEYLLLKYNYYADKTDWSNPIVRQCRGIILRKDTLKPVCVPFYRFYNLGQKEADNVDFNNCKIQDKVDGSLIKIWVDEDKLHISTNGTIDAYEINLTTLGGGSFNITFGAAVEKLIEKYKDLFFNDKNSTHMFELVTPYNKVVVDYGFDVKLYYLGSRDNNTFQEYRNKEMYNSFSVIEEFSLNEINENKIRELANNRPEGLVIVDDNYKRVKVKNPQYLLLSKTIEGLSDKVLLETLAKKDEAEFYATVQDSSTIEKMNILKKQFDLFISTVEKDRIEVQEKCLNMSKKEKAQYILSKFPAYEQSFLFNHDKNLYDFILNNIKKSLKILKENY